MRDPAKAADLAARRVHVRAGDFGHPQSLLHAFEGATQLLIMSSNAAASGGDPVAHHVAAIEAARAAGVHRIVYTSHMGASAISAFPPMRDHRASEAMLERSGLAWTALRNGFYAASGLMLLGDALTTGLIEAPADGKVAWTAHEDLAEAAAIILTRDGEYDGPTHPLTAEQAFDLADLAAIASTPGRPVRRETITDDQLRERMTARSRPHHLTDVA